MYGGGCKEASGMHLGRGYQMPAAQWSASAAIAVGRTGGLLFPSGLHQALFFMAICWNEYSPESWSSNPEVSFPEA